MGTEPQKGAENANTEFRSEKKPIRNSTSVTLNAFSRVTASLGLMVLCGLGGSWLDRWLGFQIFTVCGFVLGGILMLVGMMYAVRASEYERRQLLKGVDASQGEDDRP